MEPEMAKEVVALIAETVKEIKPSKHIVLVKWISLIGFIGLLSGWATWNTVVARWNAVPILQARTDQSMTDIASIRETVSEHKNAQALDMLKVSHQLETITQKQAEQKEQLAKIESKIDRINSPLPR